ncbi:hypothetical protein SNE40_005382 [Patella caerulea]|uniref:RRM domain-containing protein n=1 Tax=Patella caerulea TaxID=87958 RepID=A0AAN8K9X8_PATCE
MKFRKSIKDSQTPKEGNLKVKKSIKDSLTPKEGKLKVKKSKNDSLTPKEGKLKVKKDSMTLKEEKLKVEKAKKDSLTTKEGKLKVKKFERDSVTPKETIKSEIIYPKRVQVIGLKKDAPKKKINVPNQKSFSQTLTQKKIIAEQKEVLRNVADIKLIVKNLSFKTKEENLKQLFNGASSIHVPKFSDTGNSKGFAFVTYKSRDEANIVKRSMNRRKIDGRRISIHFMAKSEVKNQDSKSSTPKKPDLYPRKPSSVLQVPRRQYSFADDSD